MNHIEQIKTKSDLLQRYRDFLPICPVNKLAKMANEIFRVDAEILALENKRIGDSIKEDVSDFYGEFESSLNFSL